MRFRRRLLGSGAWRLWAAQSQRRAGRVAAAETDSRKALASRRDSGKALAELGKLLLRERRFEEAVEVWRRSVAVSPHASGPAFQLARALHRSGHLEQAAEQYLRVVGIDRDHEKACAALEQLMRRFLRSERSNNAAANAVPRIAEQLLELQPYSLSARQCTEAIARAIAEAAATLPPDLALARFELALRLADELPEALRGAAECLERLHRLDESTRLWERFARAYPAAVEPRLQLDRLRALLGPSKRGVFLAFARRLWRRLSLALASRGPGKSSLAHARRLLRLADPASAVSGRAMLGDLLSQAHSAFNEGNFDQTEALLRRILGVDVREPAALSLLSRLCLRRRQWAKAATSLKALSLIRPSEARRVAQSALSGGADDCQIWLLLAEIHAASDETAEAAAALGRIAEAATAPAGVGVAAARLACRIGRNEDARRLYERAEACDPSENLAIEIARFYSAARLDEDAIARWRGLLGLARVTVEAINQITRIRYLQSRFTDVVQFVQAHAGELFDAIEGRSAHEQNGLILVVYRYAQCADQLGNEAALLWLLERLDAANPNAPVTCALRARLLDRLGKKGAAEEELAKAAASPAIIAPEVQMDTRAELCVHAVRYGLYGEAYQEYARIKDQVSQPTNPYYGSFQTLCAIHSRYGGDSGALYPECLLRDILAAADSDPIGYDAVARRVMMVSGSLGQGGGEKQTVTVARSLVERGASPHLFLAVRSLDWRPADDFFVPVVNAIELDWRAYGTDWLQVSNLTRSLPELQGRSALAEAIDLLPHNYREELIRATRCILDIRPQTVHVWQDMPVVAVACLLSGVPRFFIHRGSLSPEYWQFNDYQWHTHFRPMQFIYRHLVNTPEFFFLNNSDVGCRTDANWIGVPRDGRFRVLYNAVQFESLGEDLGPNLERRREVGIPDSALVVGGSFRLAAVKRPLLWMEAAKRVLAALPEVHFLIIGGGEMTDEIIAYAASHGFSSRLHLPGRVADVGAWYRAMDVKLLTSEREGIPNAIIEAQHFGVPVVATDVGGISEALDQGKTGYVVKDATARNFADRVIAILSDGAWRRRARRLAPEFVHERFSLDRVLSQLEGYYGWKEADPDPAACAQERTVGAPSLR
jgi:glycosyltransferase involved in cell wall biosynthesis/tetratricopeptide (TPR) repeat protein